MMSNNYADALSMMCTARDECENAISEMECYVSEDYEELERYQAIGDVDDFERLMEEKDRQIVSNLEDTIRLLESKLEGAETRITQLKDSLDEIGVITADELMDSY